jgi:integrase
LRFTREEGSGINPETFTDRFEVIAKRAGLPRIRLHDLRHSYAVASLTAGIHPKVVSERLGHATITLDTYSHVLPSMDEAAASTVAALILGL